MEWEQIEEDLYRTMIPGGWLIKQLSFVGSSKGHYWIKSICFVPDDDHYWEIPKKDGA